MNTQMPMTVSARSLWFRASVALGVAASALALHATAGYAGEPVAFAGARAAGRPAGPPGNRGEVGAAQATSPSVPHVMLIMEENRNRDEVIGAADMPYFNSLASKYVDTTSWKGVGPSSLADYLAVISGSTQGVTYNPLEISFPGVPTLGSQLSEAGIPWKAYIEDLPEVASEVADSGEYVKRHNPFPYFPGINGPDVVPGSEFVPDLAEGKLPPFVWYTPNLINDGEDGKNPAVDSSLKSIVPAVQASAWYKEGGVIIITWDESNTAPDVIPTVVVSGEGGGTSFTANGNHYGTLAAIEDLYGLPLLGNAAHATPLLIPGATREEATPPTVETKAASLLTQTSATLNATVNPNGREVTKCEFEYGTTTSHGSIASCMLLPGSGTGPVAVSTSVAGLIANTTYHFRILATNLGGSSYGADQTLPTLPNPPTVVTLLSTLTSETSATVVAEVNANGGTVSDCHFDYGTSTYYGASAPCVAPPGSNAGPVLVAGGLVTLGAKVTYHFRIVASNPGGTSYGTDQTLTTLAGQGGVLGSQGQEGVLGSQEHETPPIPDAELASTSVTASSSGTVSVKVSCPAGESSCTGTLTLRTLNAVSAATAHQSKERKAVILTLAAGSFKVAGGHATTVKLHLSGKARTLLARAHVLRARATIVAHDAAGATHTTQTMVTIRAAKATHGHTS